MKKTTLVLMCVLLAAAPACAISGLEIGVKGGIADNFDQPGLSMSTYDIGRLNLMGGQVYWSKLPMVDLIVAADYSWRNETFTVMDMGFEFKLRDLAITASVVYPVKISMFNLYGGIGGGTHSFSYEFVRPVSLSLEDNDIFVPEGKTYMGYHGLIGAKTSLPAFPLGIFIEGRYATISTPGENTSFNTWTGGIFFKLP